MPGGGIWGVGPGQITDDGELTLALAGVLAPHSRLGHAPPSTPAVHAYPDDAVAAAYTRWAASGPFDIGQTTATAFLTPQAPHGVQEQAQVSDSAGDTLREHGAAAAMRRRAAGSSLGSKANGALMRAAPIALWAAELGWASSSTSASSRGGGAGATGAASLVRQPGGAGESPQPRRCADAQQPPSTVTASDVAAAACADASLSHPNATCQVGTHLGLFHLTPTSYERHDFVPRSSGKPTSL
jgi:hypothetical protein